MTTDCHLVFYSQIVISDASRTIYQNNRDICSILKSSILRNLNHKMFSIMWTHTFHYLVDNCVTTESSIVLAKFLYTANKSSGKVVDSLLLSVHCNLVSFLESEQCKQVIITIRTLINYLHWSDTKKRNKTTVEK